MLLSALVCATAVHAQQPQADAALAYRIPAGPLTTVLPAFIAQSGITLVGSGDLARGKMSPGLNGRYTPEQGLAVLLAGTGVRAVRNGQGAFVLQAEPQAAAVAVLPAVQVSATAQTATGPVYGYVATRSATGTKTDTPIIETPQSISVVTTDQITMQGAQSVSDALKYTAGISNNTGPTQDVVRLRGFMAYSGAGAIYVDGMKWPPGGLNGRIEPYGLERIEVLKGPSSILYRSATPGGMINMVSKQPTGEPQHELNVGYGSHDSKTLSGDFGGPLTADGEWSYRVVGLARDADTYQDYVPDDRVYFAPSLRWQPSAATSLTLLARYQRSRTVTTDYLPARGTFLPNPNGDIARSRYVGEPGDYFKPESKSIGYRLEHAFSDQIKLRNSVRYIKNSVDLRDSGGSNPAFASLADLRDVLRSRQLRSDRAYGTTADTSLEMKFETAKIAHTALLGVDYTQSRFDSRRRNFALAPLDVYDPVYGALPGRMTASSGNIQRTSALGLYAQDQMKIDGKWSLLLGGRQDWVRSSITPITVADKQPYDRYNAFSGRAGLVYLADNGLAPYVSFSQSFEPQSGVDRVGAKFDPTRGEQYEAGLRYQPPGSDFLLSAAVYQLKQKNVLTPDPVDSSFSVQTGEVRSRGFEVEARGRLTRSLSIIAAYAYTDSRTTESNVQDTVGQRADAIPYNQFSLWTDYAFGAVGVPGLTAGVGIRYVGSSQTHVQVDGANRAVKVPSYTTVDMAVRYEWQKWTYALNLYNLTDKRYVDTCAANCTWAPPLTVMASVGYRW